MATHKDHVLMAKVLREQRMDVLRTTEIESNRRYWMEREWDDIVIKIADLYTYSVGVGRTFDRARWLKEVGFTHRPDGSMFPWTYSRSIVPQDYYGYRRS